MFRADLHIHSRYSRATSKELTPENLYIWSQIKGLNLIGTGDITHPEWIVELEEKLISNDNGFFSLKSEYIPEFPLKEKIDHNFILTGEISSIYKKQGKTRKVHTIICFPDFESAHKLQKTLVERGFNIKSDGRPILGLDVRDLAEMCFEIQPKSIVFPAHAWTPWFSALGEKSGFDSVQDCYGDMAHHIYAVETGLSSDVPMNRMVTSLDQFVMLSNSDAHSAEKLGRNATVFQGEMTYDNLFETLQTNAQHSPVSTIDLFPQEGKYFLAGHRKCNYVADPLQALETKLICPVCNKEVTRGVMNRVAELADRNSKDIVFADNAYTYIVPLKEVLSEIFNCGEKSKKITGLYNELISKSGNELDILLTTPLDAIQLSEKQDLVIEAIRRIRNEEVFIKAGYDGEYGQIRAFRPEEIGYKIEGFNTAFNANNAGLVSAFDVDRCKELLKEMNKPKQINGNNVADDGQISLF